MILPSGAGAIHYMRHPLYGPLATLHTGEAIGLVVQHAPAFEDLLPGLHSDAMQAGGATMAQLASIAVISMSAPAILTAAKMGSDKEYGARRDANCSGQG